MDLKKITEDILSLPHADISLGKVLEFEYGNYTYVGKVIDYFIYYSNHKLQVAIKIEVPEESDLLTIDLTELKLNKIY